MSHQKSANMDKKQSNPAAFFFVLNYFHLEDMCRGAENCVIAVYQSHIRVSLFPTPGLKEKLPVTSPHTLTPTSENPRAMADNSIPISIAAFLLHKRLHQMLTSLSSRVGWLL